MAYLDFDFDRVAAPCSEPFPANAAPARRCHLSLALQGGALGAFTWGVLDRLLKEDIVFGAVSGSSAGTMNAVVLASGLAEGGAETARLRLSGSRAR